MKNILLIGLPGSGKSFFGKDLAEETGMDFVDLDLLIVEREKLTIEEIFKNKGEKVFRKIETEVLKTFSKDKNTVIATGGGIILSEENRRLMGELGIVVFLNRDPKNILADVDLTDRPLLKDRPQKLEEIHKERLTLYEECADFVVDGNLSSSKLLKLLLDIVNLRKKELNLALVGDPVAHSLSPIIHKSILNNLVKSIKYEKLKIERARLDYLEEIIDKGFLKEICFADGFNVTMPHKADIIKFIDRVEAKALEMNSVNTVVLKNGISYGYSTDGRGIIMALEKLGKSFEGADVMIFGRGGAGSVAAYEAAVHKAAKIETFSRSEGIDRKGKSFKSYSELKSNELLKSNNVQIIINASPVGMMGVEDVLGDYGFLDKLKENGAVLDMVYHPPKTRLILEAEKRGIPACNGLSMLIGQALEADNIFLGLDEGLKLGRKKAYEKALNNVKQ